MYFTKMHGLGNDYLFHFGQLDDVGSLSVKLSDRHFGIGSDGIITIEPSETADFKMRIFNADGSEAKMCGNGIRCVGKYVYEKGYTEKSVLNIETLSGIKTLHLEIDEEHVRSIAVDMGEAVISEEKIIKVLDKWIRCIPVSMGNPHAVIFVPDISSIPLESVGKAMEKHEAFPGGVNVEFVEVIGENHLRMRVWERGSGITLACGTGACASTAAAISKGFCVYDQPVQVELDGGSLYITIDSNNQVHMLGPAEFICDCEV